MRTIPAIGVSLLLLFGRVIAQPHAPSPLLSDADIASTPQHAMRSVGTLITELLPFDYSQFGSLPGVA